MKLKELKRGDFFTKRSIPAPGEAQVWVRGEFDRSARRYCCHRWDDINTFCLLDGSREVFCDFVF